MLASFTKSKRKTFGFFPLLLMLVMGSAFTWGGYVGVQTTQIDESWPQVTGEVVDLSTRVSDGSTLYAAVVQYEVAGESYRVTSSSASSLAPALGSTREVAYNPAMPQQAKLVGNLASNWWLYLFPLIGVAVILYGLLSFLGSLRRSRVIRGLIKNGHRVTGVVVEMYQTGKNDKRPNYRVVVSAPSMDGGVQEYVSDPLVGIGGLAMADFQTNPVPMDVYVDSANPKSYYVDIADIPNLTPERIQELIKASLDRHMPEQ